jgi:hypothetical protein
MNRILALLSAVVLGIATSVSADLVEPEVTSVLTPDGASTLTWQGTAGHTYFIETSLDEVTWTYAPVIEFGTGVPIVWSFISTESRNLVRLRYTNAPVPGGNPDNADFDNDGVTNDHEITLYGTDPFTRACLHWPFCM